MIENEQKTEAVKVVTALARFFRISLSRGKSLITVKDELEHVRNYLMIQQMRFKNKFTYTIESDDEVLELASLKLMLQPLVENAVNYALEQMEKTCRIQVVIREEDGDILCSVADNGVGIDPQILDKLKLGTIRAQGNGVGLTNLDERLKSLYGPGYGIQVENSPAGGALIRFRVKKEVSGT